MGDEFNISINFIVVIGASGEQKEVKLSGAEAAILKEFRYSSYWRLREVYGSLYQYSRPELLRAVHSLREKKIIDGVDTGYYQMCEGLNCKFVAKEEPRRFAPEKTKEELAAQKAEEKRKKASDRVMQLWSSTVSEGKKRVELFKQAMDKNVASKKACLLKNAKEQLTRDLAEAMEAKEALGFFAFSAKSSYSKKIRQFQYDLEHTEESTLVAPKLNEIIIKANQRVVAYKKQVDDYLNARFKKETTKKVINPYDYYKCAGQYNDRDDDICREILVALRKGSGNASEIKKRSDALEKISDIIIKDMIYRLQQFALIDIDFDAEGFESSYRLCESFTEEKTENWTENQAMADEPLPEMPKV